MITYSIARISPSVGSIGLLLQPVTATICAAYIFAELINITQMLFICLALLGIYLARLNVAKLQQIDDLIYLNYSYKIVYYAAHK